MDSIKPMNSTELMMFQKILDLQNVIRAANKLAKAAGNVMVIDLDDDDTEDKLVEALDTYIKLKEGLTSPEDKAFEQWFKDNFGRIDHDEKVS